jgi:cytochrome c oxidase cbb3-type subunit 3
MSDFFNSGWSVFIAVVTVVSLVACLALLVIAAKRRVMADDNTTGHVWDEDVRELNNPLPRWWMWLFVITVVFSAIYLALYPGLGSMAGALKWSSMGQFEAEQAKARETIAPIYAKYASMAAEQLAKTPEAMAIGERLYLNNCSQCHGSDARGGKGFPDLTDGGSGADYIAKTIAEGRQGAMPPMAAAIGTGDDVRNVANYVLSLSGSPHDNVAAQLGKAKFAACAACHGPDGKGNQAIGAPNLTDKVWLHGWGEQTIVAMINSGKTNVMPPQGRLLTPDQVHVLAAYVWNLSQSPRASASN